MVVIEHIKKIRLFEINKVLFQIPIGSKILEIGAGAGFQAKALSDNGFEVVGIDLKTSSYRNEQVYPVINYDGKFIPFPEDSFDVVFSSNVLEHIHNVEEFQKEIKRVLNKGGICIHILPTTTWRIWTILTHHLFVLKAIIVAIFPSYFVENSNMNSSINNARKYNKIFLIRNALWPPRHGEKGNCLTELYYFSRVRWIALFRRAGWRVNKVHANRLFYTGYQILNQRLNLKVRQRMSYVMGSSCLSYNLTLK
tara:strand:+ start:626 stop:1384 length:759 start_codon:yes stop_codon:yes gene_type:complete